MEEEEKKSAFDRAGKLRELLDKLREMQAGQEIREADFKRERRAFFRQAVENLGNESRDVVAVFLFVESTIAKEKRLRERWEAAAAAERAIWREFEAASVEERCELLNTLFFQPAKIIGGRLYD